MRSGLHLAIATCLLQGGLPLSADVAALVAAKSSDTECTHDFDLETYLMQDGTASFKKFLTEARTVLPELVVALNSLFEKSKVGVGLFGDKPDSSTSSDVCFKHITDMTEDVNVFTSAIKDLGQLCNGGDPPENPLAAMAYVAGSHGYTPAGSGDEKILRLMLVVTDVPPHFYEEGNAATPNPYPNPNLETDLECDRKTPYPPAKQVGEILQKHKIHPLVLVTTSAAKETWNDVIYNRMGYDQKAAAIVSLTMNTENLVSDLLKSILNLECAIETSSTTTVQPETTTQAVTTTTNIITATEPGGGITSETGGDTTDGIGGGTTSETGSDTTGGIGGGTTSETGSDTSGGIGGDTTDQIGSDTTDQIGSDTTSADNETTDESGFPIIPPGTTGGGNGVAVGVGSAAAGAAALGALGYLAYARTTPPTNLDIELEAEDTAQPPAEVNREAANPTESADYGEYRL